MVQESVHHGHNAAVVGGSSEHEAVVAESIFESFGHIVASDVGGSHFDVALGSQDVGEGLSSLSSVAVEAAVGNEYALVLGFVAAPSVVFIDVVLEVFTQYGAVKRADGADVVLSHFFEQSLHLSAIFATDIEVVATSFAGPSFVGVESAEFAESIG